MGKGVEISRTTWRELPYSVFEMIENRVTRFLARYRLCPSQVFLGHEEYMSLAVEINSRHDAFFGRAGIGEGSFDIKQIHTSAGSVDVFVVPGLPKGGMYLSRGNANAALELHRLERGDFVKVPVGFEDTVRPFSPGEGLPPVFASLEEAHRAAGEDRSAMVEKWKAIFESGGDGISVGAKTAAMVTGLSEEELRKTAEEFRKKAEELRRKPVERGSVTVESIELPPEFTVGLSPEDPEEETKPGLSWKERAALAVEESGSLSRGRLRAGLAELRKEVPSDSERLKEIVERRKKKCSW